MSVSSSAACAAVSRRRRWTCRLCRSRLLGRSQRVSRDGSDHCPRREPVLYSPGSACRHLGDPAGRALPAAAAAAGRPAFRGCGPRQHDASLHDRTRRDGELPQHRGAAGGRRWRPPRGYRHGAAAVAAAVCPGRQRHDHGHRRHSRQRRRRPGDLLAQAAPRAHHLQGRHPPGRARRGRRPGADAAAAARSRHDLARADAGSAADTGRQRGGRDAGRPHHSDRRRTAGNGVPLQEPGRTCTRPRSISAF